ncbi:MAG: hypothetical protein K2G67_01395 [Muribaculaceae bacterium]|nr:hypothetical protein [Muribaculaceae bacterium]
MKNLIYYFLAVLSIVILFTKSQAAVNSTVIYLEPNEVLLDTTINKSLIVGFKDRDYSYSSQPDASALPIISLNVPLPANTNFQSCTLQIVEKSRISGNANLSFTPTLTPISANTSDNSPQGYFEGVVSPISSLTYSCTSTSKAGNIVHLNLCPFEYNSTNKDLFLVTGMILSINYTMTEDEKNEDYYNPEEIETFKSCINIESPVSLDYEIWKNDHTNIELKESSVDYAIITSEALKNSFKGLKNWKNLLGVRAQIYTTEEISKTYNGTDLQEKIKKHIQKLAKNNNLKYVLLGGDDTVVPTRNCQVKCGNYTDMTPADNYYTCFKGAFNWDANGNGIYGEVTDSVDFTSNLFISRLPLRTPAHVNNYATKLIAYNLEGNSKSNTSGMLLAGVKLWNNFNNHSDAYWKGEKFYNQYIQPYWNDSIVRFYDSFTDFPEGSSYNVNTVNIQQELSKGYSFMDMMTHGSINSWSMETGASYTSSYASQLSNQGKTIITTMACNTNAFDSSLDPCLSEAFLRNNRSGIIAYLGSSRYGWGYSNLDLGPSLKYEGKFYENLFNHNVIYKNFAKLVTTAKMALLSYCSIDSAERWLQMSLNAVGDPEFQIFTSTPLESEDPELFFSNNVVTVYNTGNGNCDITVTSLADGGESYYKSVKNVVKEASFDNVNCNIYISLTKPGYIPVIYTGKISSTSPLVDKEKTMTFQKQLFTKQPAIPFGEATINNITAINHSATIGVTLAESEKNCKLIISDLFGNTVSRHDIDEQGYQQVTIDNLNPGFYVVNLISDGAIIDQAKFTSK